MDRQYAISSGFHSNSGIYEAFYAEVKSTRGDAFSATTARLFAWLHACLAVLCSAKTCRILRAVCATASLIGLVGVAGGLEAGKLSPVACLLLAALLLLAVYLSVRPKRHCG